MATEISARVGRQVLANGASAVPSLSRDGAQVVKPGGGFFQEAVERGRVFGVAAQAGVTTQAGLSATTPALTLANPAGSGVAGVIWYTGVTFSVAFAAASVVWVAVGTNTIAAVVTGTKTTTHRNLKLAGVDDQGNRIQPFLAATLPAAPVAIATLGVGLTGAITTIPQLPPMERWFNGAILLMPGCNLSIQTSTASGASATFSEYIWEEVEL